MTQKFHKGDLVRIAQDLGPSMKHFPADVDAIVVASYVDEYGGSLQGPGSYTVFLKEEGNVSWYYENQLTLIENGRHDLLELWEEERSLSIKQLSDLDWIFANGAEVAERPSGASVMALAACLGISNMWGSHGEFWVWHQNALSVMRLATPFLQAGDKDGWLAQCDSLRPITPKGCGK